MSLSHPDGETALTAASRAGRLDSLEEMFDPARLSPDYLSKGWNPPDVITRAIRGHVFGLGLDAEEKAALLAFVRSL